MESQLKHKFHTCVKQCFVHLSIVVNCFEQVPEHQINKVDLPDQVLNLKSVERCLLLLDQPCQLPEDVGALDDLLFDLVVLPNFE